MKNLILSAAMAVTFAVPAVALACDGAQQTSMSTQPASVKEVSVAELVTLKKDSKTVVYDANGADFRAKNGVIPDAKLLTNAVKYDAAKELPQSKDSKLVFYCANSKCGASHQAAKKAIEAGYSDVSVLPVGLMGWKEAGQPTVKAQPQS
ncbi:MAG: rhodanese-like domain-containing protein [Myxococcaceae bacterium]